MKVMMPNLGSDSNDVDWRMRSQRGTEGFLVDQGKGEGLSWRESRILKRRSLLFCLASSVGFLGARGFPQSLEGNSKSRPWLMIFSVRGLDSDVVGNR